MMRKIQKLKNKTSSPSGRPTLRESGPTYFSSPYIAGFNYDFLGEIGYVAGWGITDRRRHKSGKLKAAEMEVLAEFVFSLCWPH